MPLNYPENGQGWIAGTPWRDMRTHAGIRSGSGERSMLVSDYLILNRNPEWILTSDDHAGFLVPSTRTELRQMPGNSERIKFSAYFNYGQPWIRVVCTDGELEPVFLRFCETVLVELSRGNGAVDAFQLVLERFRQLFESPDDSVSAERIVGLFAELVVLEWLLEAGIDAVRAWLGPTKETHDFVIGGTHLEVKALRPSGARTFRVSNIHQMEEPPEGQLFLIGVKLAPGDQTIGSLCNQIRKMIEPKRLKQFDEALRANGCSYPVNDDWNRLGFNPDSIGAWLVDESFPRLVSSMLPNGVLPPGLSSLQYSVSLEHAGANEASTSNLLKELATEIKE